MKNVVLFILMDFNTNDYWNYCLPPLLPPDLEDPPELLMPPPELRIPPPELLMLPPELLMPPPELL
jgi:hypothetical protein